MNAESEGRTAAERFRRQHQLGTQPLGDLVALIEHTTGIDVAVLDAGPDEHGLTMRDPERGAVFIAVARTRHPMRQRSTLAHELAHVIFEDWTIEPNAPVSSNPTETRANSFARHLLAPGAGVAEVVGHLDRVDRSTLSKVVQRFEVSPALAAIALEQTGYIDPATKEQWAKLTTHGVAARFGWSDQYRALQEESDQQRAPQKLLARAISGYLENVVSVQTIAAMRGMEAARVESELHAEGLKPQDLAIAWADPADLPRIEVDLSDLDEDEPEGSVV